MFMFLDAFDITIGFGIQLKGRLVNSFFYKYSINVDGRID